MGNAEGCGYQRLSPLCSNLWNSSSPRRGLLGYYCHACIAGSTFWDGRRRRWIIHTNFWCEFILDQHLKLMRFWEGCAVHASSLSRSSVCTGDPWIFHLQTNIYLQATVIFPTSGRWCNCTHEVFTLERNTCLPIGVGAQSPFRARNDHQNITWTTLTGQFASPLTIFLRARNRFGEETMTGHPRLWMQMQNVNIMKHYFTEVRLRIDCVGNYL